jgi:uncharacterized membrane protein HdeD (DUF308 family)
MFLATGLTQLLTLGRLDSWRWLHLVGAVLSITAGILCLAWPGRTLLVVSLLAWFLVVKGIVDAVGALANPRLDWWWAPLLLGVAALPLGV